MQPRDNSIPLGEREATDHYKGQRQINIPVVRLELDVLIEGDIAGDTGDLHRSGAAPFKSLLSLIQHFDDFGFPSYINHPFSPKSPPNVPNELRL